MTKAPERIWTNGRPGGHWSDGAPGAGDAPTIYLRADTVEARLAAAEAMAEALGVLAEESSCRCMFISADTERDYENGICPHQEGRAALAQWEAAKGGEG